MKRPLLIAALLAAPIAVGGAVKAEPLQMFNIQTPSAGVVNFSGTGTANFNQSLGTNNSFNVGSSTNLGVNASASSTSDYTSTGSANLDLAGTSRIQQTIGTATSAFNTQTVSDSAASSAANVAEDTVASSSTGESWSQSWEDSSSFGDNYTYHDEYTDAGGTTYHAGYYYDMHPSDMGWDDTQHSVSENYKSVESYQEASEEAWQEEYDEAYSTVFSDRFEEISSASASEDTSDSSTGTISGVFSTVNKGAASTGLESSSATDMIEQSASAAANSAVGGADFLSSDFNSTNATVDPTANGGTPSAQYLADELAYEEAYAEAYASTYSDVMSSANSAIENSSNSSVEVKGIGVIADVNAASTSNFAASSELVGGAVRDGNGNGNASAGANLATSSYANQSNSTTANAFMQAFSGGGIGASVTVDSARFDAASGKVELTETTTYDATTATREVDATVYTTAE